MCLLWNYLILLKAMCLQLIDYFEGTLMTKEVRQSNQIILEILD